MNLLQAAVLGLVEGITEYLPVSSTGHLILAAWLLGLGQTPSEREAVNAFNVIIQGGAILAVIGLYRGRIASMIRGLLGRDPAGLRLFILLVTAFIPAAVFGVLLDDWIEARFFKPIPVLAALFLGGVVLIIIRRWLEALHAKHRAGDHAGFKSIEELSLRDALIVGLMQCVAMWPGTSRSMMTILGGLVVGLPPARAAEFSFLVGLPTLLGACTLKTYKQLKAHGLGFVEPLGGWGPVLLGLAVATVSAAIAVRWLVGYLSRHSLAIFGWWRIGVALVLGGLIMFAGLELNPPAKASAPAAPNQPAR
ncbi:MAG: undecaprenyl-diphosphate phosphatase [Phycisphaerales bacterium]